MTANEYMKNIKDNLDSVEQNLEQIQCDDAISRQAVLDVLTRNRVHFVDMIKITSELKALPPVAPNPKTGKWIDLQLIPDDITGHMCGECSECHKVRIVDKYCPNCGAKMVEPQKGGVNNG